MKFLKRKKIILVGMLALIVCLGVLNNRLSNDQNLSASAGYTDYEMEQMNLHDGDVLVDSLNLTAVPGTSSDAATDTTDVIDTAANAGKASHATGEAIDISMIVTSDNYAELANADVFFEEVRATINMDRNQVLSMLTDVIEESSEGPEKKNATEQKLKIIDYMNKEKVIENLLKNKGFGDSLVLMTDNSVNVTVNKQEITQSDVAKITDIVMRETGRNASQIVIQSKY
ncbi:MAG: SpoIIIAH-like family protein [Anaerovoracaceae bacterium]|jgi:stage III sporulation protein AH|nr:SpoIIIAH-like family protein [Clostridiales bacterium]